jgi:hypothetical protein
MAISLSLMCCREPDERPKGPWGKKRTRRSCVKPSPSHSLFCLLLRSCVCCLILFVFIPLSFVSISLIEPDRLVSHLDPNPPSFMEISFLIPGRSIEPQCFNRPIAVGTHTQKIHYDTPSMASMTPTTSVFSNGGFQSRLGDLRLSMRVVSGSGSSVLGPLLSWTGGGAANGDGAKVPPPPVKSALIRSGRFFWPGPPLARVRLRYQERSSDPYPSAAKSTQKRKQHNMKSYTKKKETVLDLMKYDRPPESRNQQYHYSPFLF